LAERVIMTQLAEASDVKDRDIADAFGIHAVSLSRFVSQSREGGAAALMPSRPGPRRPSKLTPQMKARIVKLHEEEGLSSRVIAQRVSNSKRKISYGSVAQVLRESREEFALEALDDSAKTPDTDVTFGKVSPPRTGVEIVSVEERNGVRYYIMRDLRNGNVVKNVTRSSARRLWRYAITAFDKLPSDLLQADVQWQNDLGLLRHQKQGRINRYDLVQRVSNGKYRTFFGVTEDGIHGEWKLLVGNDDD
jgi:transposase